MSGRLVSVCVVIGVLALASLYTRALGALDWSTSKLDFAGNVLIFSLLFSLNKQNKAL
jgi:hypothetical protein